MISHGDIMNLLEFKFYLRMFKKSLEGFPQSHSKNQKDPNYPTVFDAEGHEISNREYNFSGVEALYDDPATNNLSTDVNREYDLENIGKFINVNKPAELEEGA